MKIFRYPPNLSQNKMENSYFLDQNVYQDGIVLRPLHVYNTFLSFALKTPRQRHHGAQSAAPSQHPGHILCRGGERHACHLAYMQDIEQTQHHWSGSQQCLHHLQYSGNVATVSTVQTF